jgi:hypothetical protein
MRHAVGIHLRELAKYATDSMRRCLELAVPQLFFGMHDDDHSIRTIYEHAWEEHLAGMYSRKNMLLS